MTSQRKLKKQAEALGMTATELRLAEMLEEVLEDLRWMQILAYANQYLLSERLEVDKEERDRILEAATRAVEKDLKQHARRDRLDRLKAEIAGIRHKVSGALEEMAAEKAAESAAEKGPRAEADREAEAGRGAEADREIEADREAEAGQGTGHAD